MAIIDTAIDGIIVIDSRGIIEEINQSALKLFEYQRTEVIGQNVSILMPSPDRENHDGYINRYLTTKKPKIIGIGREVFGKKKQGGTFPFRLAVSEVILNDRIIFTGIVHDLTELHQARLAQEQLTQELESRVIERTGELEQAVNRLLNLNTKLESEINERKRAEKKLRSKEQELKIALRNEKELHELKGRFISMASHEFRTPLSTILSSVNLIARYPAGSEQNKRLKHINRIQAAVNNLTGILNDFLSLGKLEEGKVILSPTEVDVRKLCHDVKEEVEGMLATGQEIEINTDESNLTIITDARILKNVLFNLVSNAIKYSIKGTNVGCTIKRTQSQIQIDIKDQGLGIPTKDQQHLFERFFRASNVETIQGTGLGLSIVLKYLELIGGTITYESEENVGSVFTLFIPIKSTI